MHRRPQLVLPENLEAAPGTSQTGCWLFFCHFSSRRRSLYKEQTQTSTQVWSRANTVFSCSSLRSFRARKRHLVFDLLICKHVPSSHPLHFSLKLEAYSPGLNSRWQEARQGRTITTEILVQLGNPCSCAIREPHSVLALGSHLPYDRHSSISHPFFIH